MQIEGQSIDKGRGRYQDLVQLGSVKESVWCG